MPRVVDQFDWERFGEDLFDRGGFVTDWNNQEVEALCARHCLGGYMVGTMC